jgi:4a-hydroxytetrahydrobiopterin dehydratase
VHPLHRQVPEWEIVAGHHLHRHFSFDDFVGALRFVNRIGEVAEAEAHHPNIMLTWGKVEVEIWTHKIDGLTESDFILAAKLDELPRD